jgi:hypothetical protein
MSDSPCEDEPIVYSYSRRQALDDGVLVDLTDFSPGHGFVFPVACTAGVYHRYLVPDKTLQAQGQSIEARIHDLLTTLAAAIKSQGDKADRLTFQTSFLMPLGRTATVTFTCICGPDDAGEPVLTILLPGED